MTDRQTQGTIVSIHSDVIDAHFPARLPKLNHLLRAGEENEYAMEVVSYLDEETVRTISLTPTQGLARGDAIRDTGDTLTVPVGRSVSRVGGKTQLPAYQAVAGALRLSYTQFTELESFARFGARLDKETQQTLRRGRHIRAVLQQPQYAPMPVPEQIAVLLAVSRGVFDRLPLERMTEVEQAVRNQVTRELPELCHRIARGEPLRESDREEVLRVARSAISAAGDGPTTAEDHHGNA